MRRVFLRVVLNRPGAKADTRAGQALVCTGPERD